MDGRTTKARYVGHVSDRYIAHGTKAISRNALSRITRLSGLHRFLLANHDTILEASEGRNISWKNFLMQPEVASQEFRDFNGKPITPEQASRIWLRVRKYYETQKSMPIANPAADHPSTAHPSLSKTTMANRPTTVPAARTGSIVPVVPTGSQPSGGLAPDSELPPGMNEVLDQLATMEFNRHGVVPKSVKEIKATIAAKSRECDDEPPKSLK